MDLFSELTKPFLTVEHMTLHWQFAEKKFSSWGYSSTLYLIGGKCLTVGTQTHADVSHSMFFISYSWEMKANTKPYKIKLQKTNCLRSQYFISTIHHEMIKNLIETISIYIFFFYLHLIQRKLVALCYIFSFNLFLCKQNILLQESSSLVFWHHFEVCTWTTILSRTRVVAATQTQRWSQSKTTPTSWRNQTPDTMICESSYWLGSNVGGNKGRPLVNRFVPSFKRIDWAHFFTESMFGVAYYYTTHTICRMQILSVNGICGRLLCNIRQNVQYTTV